MPAGRPSGGSLRGMDVPTLRDALLEADYTTDAVLDRIGEAGQAGLGRNSTVPADVALAGATDPLALLVRLFILQQDVDEHAWRGWPLADGLVDAGLLATDGERLRAVVDIRPYGSPDDGASGYLVSDLTPGLDGRDASTRVDYVLGASPASLTLTQLTMRSPGGRALDLGTGCGVQALHLARHCEQVVATDLNQRALALASLGMQLSGVEVDLRAGSIFEPVAGERFDLIVSNPPYVMSPPTTERLTYREGSLQADGLTEAIVREAPAYLNPGGSLQLLTNWAIVEDQPWEDRLRSWVQDSGCDLWVIERERLDRFAYIEMWLTDAGLAGTDRWEPAYREWLAYFETLGIQEVGMGWLLLTRAGRDVPHVRIESWPHAVTQPVGHVFARHHDAVTAAALSESSLLELRPRLRDVLQETMGAPGAEHPEHIVLRQTAGLLRGLAVSTVTGAVLGALDGELSVAQVAGAVAQILELDTRAVADEALPIVRRALEEQYLFPR